MQWEPSAKCRCFVRVVLLLASALGPKWRQVTGLSFEQLVAWGTLYYTYAILLEAIAEELEVASTTVAGGMSLALLVSALLAPRVGVYVDEGHAKRALVIGAFAGGGALLLVAASQGAISLLGACAVLGVAQAFGLYEPALRLVVSMLPKQPLRSRGLLCVTLGGGLASVVFVPLSATLVARVGFRGAALVSAGLLFLAAALAWRTLPEAHAETLARNNAQAFPPSMRWLGACLALHSFATAGLVLYLVWHFVERGQSLEAAALVAGMVGASQLPGRFVLGIARPTDYRLGLILAVQAAATIGIALLPSPHVTFAVLLFGAAKGMVTLERPILVLAWYGDRAFGTKSGRLASARLFAKAAAPLCVAWMHRRHSYASIFVGLGLVLAVAVVFFYVARRLVAVESFEVGKRESTSDIASLRIRRRR